MRATSRGSVEIRVCGVEWSGQVRGRVINRDCLWQDGAGSGGQCGRTHISNGSARVTSPLHCIPLSCAMRLTANSQEMAARMPADAEIASARPTL